MGFDNPVMKAIDKGGGQECDVAGVMLALERAGYVIVPKEPTQRMLDHAFINYMGYERQGPSKSAWNGRSMWNAMILAFTSAVCEEK